MQNRSNGTNESRQVAEFPRVRGHRARGREGSGRRHGRKKKKKLRRDNEEEAPIHSQEKE